MANIKYLRCIKCGKQDVPSKGIIQDGKLIREANTGTATVMRCRDCAKADGHAMLCRACCPTGHGTRWNEVS